MTAHPLKPLTDRQATVRDLMTTGMRSKEIAEQLHISHRTVEVHRREVFAKYGVRNAVELTRKVLTA